MGVVFIGVRSGPKYSYIFADKSLVVKILKLFGNMTCPKLRYCGN